MATLVACPSIVQQFFLNDGTPAVGGSVLTQVGSVNTPTYSDSAGTIPLPNPIPLNSRGEISTAAGASSQLFLTPNVVYTFTLSDANGNQIWSEPYVNGTQLTQQDVGKLIYPQTPQEITAGVTPTTYLYPPGNVLRYGAVADGVTDCTLAFQNALTANANAYPVTVPSAVNFYNLTSYITAPAETQIILGEAAWMRWTATTATGPNFLGSATRPGILITGDNFKLEGRGALTGPGVTAANSGAGGGGVQTFVLNEFAILAIGSSATSRLSGIDIRDVQLALWGQGGICTQFCQDIYITECNIHDIGYQGIVHLSAQNSRVQRNKVYGIAPGVSGNAYGITHTHDSTNYNTDPNVTTLPRQTVNPFCIDVDVSFNEVRDVPLWNGIDAHGGYETHFHHNKVYNCHRALQLSASSGAASNYAGEDNSVTDNVIYGAQINGNATTDANGFQAGVVVNGGSTLTHRGVLVARNHFFGVGQALVSPTVFVIEATFCTGVIIQANTFHGCVGRMIYMAATTGEIRDNFLDSVGSSATGSNFIYPDNNCGPLLISGNIHAPLSGTLTPCTNGINTPGSGYTRFVISGNDLTACTNPYTNINGTYVRGLSELTPSILDSTTGSHTVDVSVVGAAPRFIIQATQGSAGTLTSLLNPGFIGQECVISMTGSNTLTVNNVGNIKLQGGSAALTSSSELTMIWDGSKWQERSRSIGNT